MAANMLSLEALKLALPERLHPLFGNDFRIDPADLHRLLQQPVSQRDKDLHSLLNGILQLAPGSLPDRDAHGLLPPNGFLAIHALNLLAQTRQSEFLEALLPLLRRNANQLKALLGNFLTESLWEILYHLAGKDWSLLADLVREQYVSDEVKESLFVCVVQFAWHQPILRPEVFSWFRELLSELNLGKIVFSQPLLGALVKELGDLRAAPLLGEMEELWRQTEWPVGLTGTIEQWKSSMDDPVNGWARRPIHNLASRYRFYVSTLFPSSPENKAEAVRIDLPAPAKPMRKPRSSRSFSRPKTPIKKGNKVGRNDPCPCGSGKKYKKCHGK